MTPTEILEARKRLGLTQAELAEVLDVDRKTVNRWERGKCPIRKSDARELERMVAERAINPPLQ